MKRDRNLLLIGESSKMRRWERRSRADGISRYQECGDSGAITTVKWEEGEESISPHSFEIADIKISTLGKAHTPVFLKPIR